MNINELKKWAEEQNVSTRIIESFKKLLINLKKHDPIEYHECVGELNIEKLIFEVHTVSLNLGNWPMCNYNSVSVEMRVNNNDIQIAKYKLVFSFNGDPIDDFVDFLPNFKESIIGEEKYPDLLFEHYIVTSNTSHIQLTKAGFTELANLYKTFEPDSVERLISEITLISDNNDWEYFSNLANELGVYGLSSDILKEMAEVAVQVLKYESGENN